jgi:hypothetical protein
MGLPDQSETVLAKVEKKLFFCVICKVKSLKWPQRSC